MDEYAVLIEADFYGIDLKEKSTSLHQLPPPIRTDGMYFSPSDGSCLLFRPPSMKMFAGYMGTDKIDIPYEVYDNKWVQMKNPNPFPTGLFGVRCPEPRPIITILNERTLIRVNPSSSSPITTEVYIYSFFETGVPHYNTPYIYNSNTQILFQENSCTFGNQVKNMKINRDGDGYLSAQVSFGHNNYEERLSLMFFGSVVMVNNRACCTQGKLV